MIRMKMKKFKKFPNVEKNRFEIFDFSLISRTQAYVSLISLHLSLSNFVLLRENLFLDILTPFWESNFKNLKKKRDIFFKKT